MRSHVTRPVGTDREIRDNKKHKCSHPRGSEEATRLMFERSDRISLRFRFWEGFWGWLDAFVFDSARVFLERDKTVTSVYTIEEQYMTSLPASRID